MNNPTKIKDFNDLKNLYGASAVKFCIENAKPPAIEKKDAPTHEEESQHKNQASVIVSFVRDNVELFHDKDSHVYATDNATGETRRIDGRAFKDWLSAKFYEQFNKSIREQSLKEALSTLTGIARHQGESKEVYLRVAKHGEAYIVDLAEPGNNRVACIKAGQWEILEHSPVKFRRLDAMRPLPQPMRDGDINQLWSFVNIPENARMLILAWLIECLRTDTPFPILELIGEQGSAKSTTQTILRNLIDPNSCNLRAAPKNEEDIFVSADNSWLVSYENLSYLSAPMQNSLCTVATGGGHAKRKLYSDADEVIINVIRPAILNGISAIITAHDLIDRSLSIEIPTITHRSDSAELHRRFNAEAETLFGALLTLFAAALKKLPTIHLPGEQAPRLIEFAKLGMAVAEVMGLHGDEFLTAFNFYREESIARIIDANPVASAVIAWLEKNPRGSQDTVKNLYQEIGNFKPPYAEAWPHSPKGFADQLRRVAPALRSLGIECNGLGKIGGHVKWNIRKKENISYQCPASPNVLVGSEQNHHEQDIKTSRTSFYELSSQFDDYDD